jgi:DNA helicase IV
VAVVVPEDLVPEATRLARRDTHVGVLERDAMTRPVTIVPAPAAKGLEFDAVVVVEPAAIADDDQRGLRLLYVALTRPIQHLSVVHAQPLPASLLG